MSSLFSSVIKKHRKLISLTQSQICELLVDSYGKEFKSLEPTTYSRWENGSVTPKHRRQAMILDELGIIEKISLIEIKNNLSLSEKKKKLIYKLFPLSNESLYFKNRRVENITSDRYIYQLLSTGKLKNYFTHTNTELKSLYLDLIKEQDKYANLEKELLILKLDNNIYNHIICLRVLPKVLGSGTDIYDEIQLISSKILKENDIENSKVLIIQGVITDKYFFHSVVRWIFKKNINEKITRKSLIFIWSYSDIWDELYETLGAIPLVSNYSLDNKVKLYVFLPYEFLSSPNILELTRNS